MKVGFGGKKQKQKHKKKQKKEGKQGKQQGADGDDVMQDAAAVPASTPEPQAPPSAAAAMDGDEAAAPGAGGGMTAKDKQRSRMELKKALKVQVAALKIKRNKLTKLAANKTERRVLNTQLRGLMQEELFDKGGSSKSRQGKQQQQQQHGEATPADADGMAD